MSGREPIGPAAEVPAELPSTIRTILLVGLAFAVAVLLLGLGLLLGRGGAVETGTSGHGLPPLAAGLGAGDPYSVLWLGVFLLILTPLARVVASVVLFGAQGDRPFTAMTLFVLAVLVGTTLFGVGA